jgi:phospholipid-binding lipoprotein MlaA
MVAAVRNQRIGFIICLTLLVWACTAGGLCSNGVAFAADPSEDGIYDAAPEPGQDISDPLEKVNRGFFKFNDRFYFWFMKPIARVYGCILPEGLRISIRNAFTNIHFPMRFVNSALQCKFHKAGTELARFTINSTMGVGGLFDVATTHFNIRPSREDTGQTFGVWGIGQGIYIVWPILGSSNVRDTFGTVGDAFLNPIHYIVDDSLASGGISAGRELNNTSLRIGEYEDFKAAALDPYVAMRQAYVQHRFKLIRE